MYLTIEEELFIKLVKISNIKRQYLGDCAVELLEKAIRETNLKDLRNEYGRKEGLSGGANNEH